MASFTRPKGVRALTSGEWFYHNSAAGFGITNTGPGEFAVALLNNDQSRWLFVYAISASAGDETFAYYYQQQGIASLSLYGPCFPVVSDDPAPPGQIYIGNATPVFAPGFNSHPAILMNVGNDGAGGVSSVGEVRSQSPIAVIKPGFALFVQARVSCTARFQFLFMGP